MAVYIELVILGAAMTIETFLRHALLRRWYDLFLALPVWLGWFLAAAALYFLLLYLLSLTVDKAKPEIFDIPIAGSVVHKCFFLSIDREDNRKALGTILHAAELLREGTVSIGVYPEGTRSKTGELLLFRNGAFQIAKRAGAPIVIAKTTGTEQIARRFARRRTIVRFDILDALSADTAAKMTTREIGEYAREQMLQSEPATPTKKEEITV